jgi:hypothetical protein
VDFNRKARWVLNGHKLPTPEGSTYAGVVSRESVRIELTYAALKSAGRNHLRSCMHHGGFKSCPADPDVWMRSAIKSDGTEVYEYVLLYTDDALYWS